ncbi:unnamed protein product [Ixodes pacificus]
MTSEQKRMSILMFSHSSKIGYLPRPLPAIEPKFEKCSYLRRKVLFPPMKKGRSRACLRTQLETSSVNHCDITACDSIGGVTVERYHKLQFVLFLQQQLLARSSWGNNVDVLLKTSQCIEQTHS